MQHKKQISDQASGCAKRELDKERKYQKKSVAADWFVNFKEFMQSNSQERSNRGSCSTEKSFVFLFLFFTEFNFILFYCIRGSIGRQWREAR